MKIWFNEFIPSRFNPILKMINLKYIEISINGHVLAQNRKSTSSSINSSSNYTSSSSSNSPSSAPLNQRDSGDRSDGRGDRGLGKIKKLCPPQCYEPTDNNKSNNSTQK